jgi:hypothetical protein
MNHSLKKIPQELRRFAVLGVVAGMLTTAVIYSRDQHVPSEGVGNGSKQAFQQPKDRQQAEGWFTPTPRSENGPSDPCQLVGERDRQHGVMQSVLGGIDPDLESVAVPVLYPDQDDPSRLHEQRTQVVITVPRYCTEDRAVSCGDLLGHQSEPSTEVTPLGEHRADRCHHRA